MESQKTDQKQAEENFQNTSVGNENTEASPEEEKEISEQSEQVSEQTEEVLEQSEQSTEQSEQGNRQTNGQTNGKAENLQELEAKKNLEEIKRVIEKEVVPMVNSYVDQHNQKAEKKKTLSIKTTDGLLEKFRNAAQNFSTQEAFFAALMENYFNPPIAPEPEIKTVVQEKTIEVERKLQAGEHLVKFSEAEEKTLGLISINRMHEMGKKQPPGYGPVKAESFGEILRKSFFNKSRLFNLDNTFFTGLSKRDLKS